MPDVIRTPDERFQGLPGYPFEPRYLDWDGLRVHYVDEGSGPPVLMLHGEPTWSHLYRAFVPALTAAGYRAIAPDYVGFGRSDKVTDDAWYVIERHVDCIRHLIDELGLEDITLVCQDWGGPIGLRQAVDAPDRFARLVILNTWLHHDGYEYSEGIRNWHEFATRPDGEDLPAGRIVASSLRTEGHDRDAVQRAYDAPFTGIESKAGIRRFPRCLPFASPADGNANDQQRCFDALTRWDKPANLIWSDSDVIFTLDWAREWGKQIPGSTLDVIAGPGHFLQEERGAEIVKVMLGRMGR